MIMPLPVHSASCLPPQFFLNPKCFVNCPNSNESLDNGVSGTFVFIDLFRLENKPNPPSILVKCGLSCMSPTTGLLACMYLSKSAGAVLIVNVSGPMILLTWGFTGTFFFKYA